MGHKIQCYVSRELLKFHFDELGMPNKVFKTHQGKIQHIAEKLIREGRVNERGQLFLCSTDIRR